MKNVLLMLLFTCSVYSQNDSIKIKKYFSNLKVVSSTLTINTVNSNSGITSSYNPTTGTNDIYYSKNDSLVHLKSVINLNNVARNPKTDSSNPYGASDVKSGVIMGGLGKLFSFIFK